MQNFTHEQVSDWAGGRDFIVHDNCVSEYWTEGCFTPEKQKATVFKGKFDNNEQLSAFNKLGCQGVLLS